jgi:thiol-disulfide isomerase/thioredoxin
MVCNLTRLAVVLSLLALPAVGCQRSGGVAEARVTSAGKAAAIDAPKSPENDVAVQLLDYAGIEGLIAGHRGKVVVMDCWSTSCPPCIRDFPELVALQARYGREQLACISLSFDYEGIGEPAEKLPRVQTFLEQQDARFDNVLSSEESDVLYRKFHLASIPAVFVYDKAGVLRHRFDDQKAQSEAEHFTYQDVDRLVAELVAEESSSER